MRASFSCHKTDALNFLRFSPLKSTHYVSDFKSRQYLQGGTREHGEQVRCPVVTSSSVLAEVHFSWEVFCYSMKGSLIPLSKRVLCTKSKLRFGARSGRRY